MDDLSILRLVATDPDAYIAFAGELMLANKREGQRWQITFDVAMDTDSHPMNNYTGRATGKAGTRFMALLVEIDDTDQPVNQEHKRAAKAQSMGNVMGKSLVKESGILRNDIYFTRFLFWKVERMNENQRANIDNYMPFGLVTKIRDSGGKVLADPKIAKRFNEHVIHFLCDVISCREFAYSKPAADKFNRLRMEFMEWVNQRGQRGQV